MQNQAGSEVQENKPVSREGEPAPREERWVCAACGREADPLYFCDGKRVCEACRRKRARARPAGSAAPEAR